MARFLTSVFLILFATSNVQAERFTIKGLIVEVPRDYDFSWFDGDSEKAAILASGRLYGSLHITFFKKAGQSAIEYNPSAADARQIDAFLAGKVRSLPDFYPHRNRKTFHQNLNRNVLESLTLSEFENGNIQFTRRLIFADAEYCYVVSLSIKNVDIVMPQEMTDHFSRADDSGRYRWKTDRLEKLNEDFSAGRSFDGYLEPLEIEADKIFAGLRGRI